MNPPEKYSENFVNKFTLAIIRVIERQEFKIENPVFVDADLIPRLSRGLVQSIVEKRRAIETLESERRPTAIPIHPAGMIQSPQQQLQSHEPGLVVPPMGPPMQRGFTPEEYGPITALLSDPTITKIIMPSPAQPVSVIRMGQKEFTKIVLSVEQVKQIFDRMAENAHLPLLEGTFRAALDNFSVNAVYSSLVGSKFVIEKQTPYSNLNPQTNK